MPELARRSQAEILARIENADDPLGFKLEVLVAALTFDNARRYLKPEVTAQEWGQPRPVERLEAEARDYLEFAIGKIVGHRGISAHRSVDKLEEFAWLLGRDDVVTAMGLADYPQYGAPKVHAFGAGMGWWEDALAALDASDVADLARMVTGLPCEDGCVSGCGS